MVQAEEADAASAVAEALAVAASEVAEAEEEASEAVVSEALTIITVTILDAHTTVGDFSPDFTDTVTDIGEDASAVCSDCSWCR